MKHANFALIKTSVFHAQKSSEEHNKQVFYSLGKELNF